MKTHPEDPRLTAYLLGELPEEEAREIQLAAAADPLLRATLDRNELAQSFLLETFGEKQDSLLPRQKDRIRRAAREAARKGAVIPLASHRRSWSWKAGLAAAAAVAVGIFVLTKLPAPETPGKGGQVANATENPPRISLDPSEAGDVVRLPLEAGNRSLPEISRSIRLDQKLPGTDAVRIDEILNAFPLHAKATVSVSGGCVLGAEVISCPWKPSGRLILVDVQGAKDGEKSLTVEYRPAEGSVSSHRILGYQGSGGKVVSDKGTVIPAGENAFLLIEANADPAGLGELVWTVDGVAAPVLRPTYDAEADASPDARFAALICAFGIWLQGGDGGAVDDATLLGLAREVAADNPPTDRYDFLSLVNQAVALAE